MFDDTQQRAVFKDEGTQRALNEPLKKESGISNEDEEFLQLIVQFIDAGKINLYVPSSLINSQNYEVLDDGRRGRADVEAMNMLGAIRDIHGMYRAGLKDTYQMENLVHRLRVSKERLEEVGGDLFII